MEGAQMNKIDMICCSDSIYYLTERSFLTAGGLLTAYLISVTNYTVKTQKAVRPSQEDMATRQIFYFSFSRISSALMPLASSFFSTSSVSAFFASSAALVSAIDFFRSKEVNSFWADLRAVIFSFKSTFRVSILAVMEVISAVREAMEDCFSAIWDAKSVVSFGRFCYLSFWA